MKIIKLSFLLSFSLIINLSYSQSADITQGCFPLSVQFTAPGGSSTYFWNFDDGATSTQQNPTNTFNSAGTYEVEFFETVGGTVIGSIIIDIYPQPTPEFTVDQASGCAPLFVNFSDNTTINSGITINGYSWVFGDGATAVGQNSSHLFNDAGEYYVSLGLITNMPSCDVTELYSDYISVSEAPNASFTTDPSPAFSCVVPFTLDFDNTSTSDLSLTYEWDFGNGETSTSENPSDITYNDEGTFQVTLTATDANGCDDNSIINVTLGQPEASFEIPDTICIDEFTSINNTSPSGIYSWTFGSNAIPSNSSLTNPSVAFTSSGYHDITLNILGECPTSTTVSVFVQDPTAEFVSSPTYSCSAPMVVDFTPVMQDAGEYEWTFGNGESSQDVNPTVTYINPDTTIYSINGPHDTVFYYEITLELTTFAGCFAEFSLIDTLHEPNALIFPDVVEGCLPLTVNYADSSITNENEPIVEWEWIFDDGTSFVTNDYSSQSHTYTEPGEYGTYLIITNSAGCTDTSYVTTISVGDSMTPDFTVDQTEVCPGEPVQFTDITSGSYADSIDAWHYTTESSMMFHCFQESDASWAYENETGPQNVTLTVEFNGCYSSATQVGLVNVLGPIAHIDYTCTCDEPFVVNFINESNDATEILWDFGDGETSTDDNPMHVYSATGDYTVTLSAFNTISGCPDSFDESLVYIRDIQASFFSDSLLCHGVENPFDASLSQDVHMACNRGFHWEFDDMSIHPLTTSDPNAELPFPNSGPVGVTLVVTDINGCTDTATNNVAIYGLEADFASDLNSVCLPSVVDFEDLSFADTTITSWSWDFGDGQQYFEQDTNHLYTISTYNDIPTDLDTIFVFLTIEDEIGCVSEDSLYIFVYGITSNLTVSDNTLCSGEMANFTATDFTQLGSNLTFDWNFGNGETSNLQNPTDIEFIDEGSYDVLLIYEEIASGCFDSTTINLNVLNFPTPSFTTSSGSDLYICPNDNVLFSNTTTTGSPFMSYSWDFGNGNTSTVTDPGTTYPDNGTYTVQLIASIDAPYGCVDTIQQTYNVQGPVGGFTTDLGNGSICRLDEVLFTMDVTSVVDTFYWDFGDGTNAAGINPISHQYTFVPPSGQTTAILVMSNSDGSCPITDEAPISIYEVIADFNRNFNDVDTAICYQPYPLMNISQNANTYFWDFGDGSTSSSLDPGDHVYSTPGTYTVLLAIENDLWGCTDTLIKDIVLHPIPDIAAFGDTICEGDIGELTVITPISSAGYIWSNITSELIFDADQPLASSSPQFTSEYEVVVLDTNSCTNNTATSILVVNDLDVSNFDTIVPMGDIVYLPLEFDINVFDLQWDPEESQGSGCLLCSPPYVQALEDETYHLIISDKFDCFEATADYEVLVHPDIFIDIPTTFTPNGDGVNDIIYVEGWGIQELLEYKIFNRYGEQVFESTKMEHGWNGYYKGIIQNNDTYAYKVKALTWRNEEQIMEGYINLMR